VAVEPNAKFARIIIHVSRRVHVDGSVALLMLSIDESSVQATILTMYLDNA